MRVCFFGDSLVNGTGDDDAIFQLTLASSLWNEEAMAGDGAHPNRGGYALLADAVSNWTPWRTWMDGPR